VNSTDARKILGVGAEASEQEIKQAFRRLALVAHPDRGGSSEAFIQVNEAYEILTGQRQSSSVSANASATSQNTKSSNQRYSTFAVATAAMSMLNLDPDEFIRIERSCYEWLGSVSQLNKMAAKQLLWLAVGRLPVGAAVSVVKGQRFNNAAKNMLTSLKDVNSPNGITSPSSWMNFAECYMQMLKLSGMKSVSKEFDRASFMSALTKIEQESRQKRPHGQY
jgi:hypothetical protein